MKTTIIGAGGGGIASALLGTLRGEQVTLLESHSKIGGCASYFGRGSFVFDAGATTLSGLAPHQPLGKLFQMLGRTPDVRPVDPGIVFHFSNGQILSYYQSVEQFHHELEKVFPGLNHRPFWDKVREVSDKAWHLLNDIETPSDILKHPSYITLGQHLLISTEMMLKKYGLDTPLYREFIDGILLISAQEKSPHIPFLVGAMALSYPAETFAPLGGMKGLMMFFEKLLADSGVVLQKRSPVVAVRDHELKLKNGLIEKTDRMIFNLPLWNLANLLPDLKNKEDAKKRPESWGAFTIYLGTKSFERDPYHQINFHHPLVDNYFVSFSLIDDPNRAPEGWQSVSISTHVKVEDWYSLTDDEYEKKKKTYEQMILRDFLPRFGITETDMVTSGTPQTFEHYVGRKNGQVGGLPFLYGMNPLPFMQIRNLGQDIYRVGDTVFPGQGLCGVVAGALRLHSHLLNTRSRP
jgi:phytoene dehydrogenase-like protein